MLDCGIFLQSLPGKGVIPPVSKFECVYMASGLTIVTPGYFVLTSEAGSKSFC